MVKKVKTEHGQTLFIFKDKKRLFLTDSFSKALCHIHSPSFENLYTKEDLKNAYITGYLITIP